MSINALSITLQNKVLERLKDNVDALITKYAQDLGKKKVITTSKGTEISVGQVKFNDLIRTVSDKNQTGIIGVAGFKAIEKSFNNIIDEINKNGYTGSKLLKDKNTFNIKSKPLKNYVDSQIKLNKSPQDIIKQLATDATNCFKNVNNLYNDFINYLKNKNFVVNNPTVGGNPVMDITEVTGLKTNGAIKPLTHAQTNIEFNNFLKDVRGVPDYLIDFISINIDAGHLLGIFTQKFLTYFGATLTSNSWTLGSLEFEILNPGYAQNQKEKEAIEGLNRLFSAAVNLLETIDFLSSSLTLYPEVFAELSKSVYGNTNTVSAVVESQFSNLNQEVGRLLLSAGKKLSDLVSTANTAPFKPVPGTTTQQISSEGTAFTKQLTSLFSGLAEIGAAAKTLGTQIPQMERAVLAQYNEALLKSVPILVTTLLNAEGSDSFLTSIDKSIKNTLEGKRLPVAQVSKVNKNVRGGQKVQKPPSVKIKLNKAKQKVQSKIKLPSKNLPRNTVTTIAANLFSLQEVLNSLIVQKVTENMGTGNRKDILNYRTGRFAKSVKIQKLTMGTSGLITAYYEYMKNPYATFSEGGRQEYPRSRDPKLLISKSIRELAAQQAITRLRAVVI